MTDLFTYVGSRIRELRMAYNNGQGLSQEKLASAIGVTTNTISRWETATYHPGLADLEKLATFFGASMLEFLPTVEEPKDEKLKALLKTVRELDPKIVDEVRQFAEFRRAHQLYGNAS